MNRHGGFTLLELLVALLVLSLGLLGAAALQVRSLQDHSLALRQNSAQFLLADITERIRANPSGLAHYVSGDEARILRTDCHLEPGCDAEALAHHDVAEFQAAVLAHLDPQSPETSLVVVPATGPAQPARVQVLIRWRSANGTDEARATWLAPSPVAG